jgi:hypothetical protein
MYAFLGVASLQKERDNTVLLMMYKEVSFKKLIAETHSMLNKNLENIFKSHKYLLILH